MEKIKLEPGDCDIIATISVKNFTLFVYYGIENRTDKDNSIIRDAIESNIEEAFGLLIKKISNNSYALDIAINENFGNFPWEDGWTKDLLNEQLTIYMPLIQKFIADAMTDTIKGK